ncbi:uncharacterized protein TNCV_745071 [Trichonephila clavipes]|nr:uncharacterized protein TNCV_745071 [Trichonephila clavipes]
MPDGTKYSLRKHTEYVLVKSLGPKSSELIYERRDWRIFPSPSVPCRNLGGGDRCCRHLSSLRGISEFRRAKSYCHLYGGQGQRQAYFLPLATVNFVGFDLTTSDRWH